MRGMGYGASIRNQQLHIIFATFRDMNTHPHEIRFYSTNDDYGYMSNFAAYSFELDGTTWPTSEHYFQAMKFNDATIQKNIRRLASPMLAARAGRDRKKPLRKDWESVKERIMYDAVLAKFTQNPDIAAELIATGNAILIEHTTKDSYWADGGDGSGKNRLGVILMRVRGELTHADGTR